ncbi:hypothetical protein Pcinc_006465 [Petrolisthes cinctipes]|uniref:Uncharacterized protein n=1 Tax=Petrolisthes cinctipes TaxID=88211 RepID=A0AAE1KZ43_PETCI|nr:hypothetical protein Pcinc_006465 [Petrolisthes cinctipes]
MVSSNLAPVLNRTKVSNRRASHIMKAAAASLGHDTETLALSQESIRHAWCSYCSAVAEDIKKTLTGHWDGKIIPDLTSGKVNHLAILVSFDGVENILFCEKA